MTEEPFPVLNAGTRSAARKRTIDVWASGDMPLLRTSRQRVMLWALGAPALLPIAFMARSVATLNGGTVHQSGNDVFGTGAALLLFAMLSITPLRTMTRRQWFVPLRRWYGVVFAFDIFLDAITASNDTAFNGGPVAELAGHTFLIMGVTMTLLLIPLCVQGIWNQRTMKQLGTYWKQFQKYGTYSVWALLGLHLALLEGLGAEGGEKFPLNVLHQRLYQYLSCSAIMLTLRLPPVRRWIRGQQNDGRTWRAWLAIAPLAVLLLVAYAYFLNELFYKGIAAASLTPIND